MAKSGRNTNTDTENYVATPYLWSKAFKNMCKPILFYLFSQNLLIENVYLLRLGTISQLTIINYKGVCYEIKD